MVRYIYFIFISFILSNQMNGQITDNLFAYYSFDDCTANDNQGSNNGIALSPLNCICGIKGQAIRFDGSQVIQLGDDNSGLNNTISSDEFTIVLSLLTAKSNSAMTVFSITEACDSYGFELIYNPSAGRFTLNIRSQTELTVIDFDDDPNACWQQIAINRLFNRVECVLNGELKHTEKYTLNPNFKSLGFPKLGGGGCAGTTTARFRGVIDEVKVYNRILSVPNSQLVTTNIVNQLDDHFQVIFTGQSYGVEFITNCTPNVTWSPTAGVSDPNGTIVELTPTQTTRYSVSNSYEGCSEVDTILIRVLDESSINCEKLLLPNSFTPNGDELNDTYGISTTYAIEGDCRFEIFNKYGGLIFATTDANGRWDGRIAGDFAPPGVYMYKVRYTCSGSKYSVAGSVNLIR